MNAVLSLVLLVLGFVFLVKGSDLFVDGASSIASKLGIPQLIIGLTIVAMGTSAPEAAVSISAAMSGSADISIGNVVGSNILNILIILGLSTLVTNIAVAKSTVRYEIPFSILATVVLLVQGLNGSVSFREGIVLWVLFIAFLTYLFFSAKKNPAPEEDEKKNLSIWETILFTILGLSLIIVGSDFAVDGATGIAKILGLSERFIGLTIVALGTSLPELFTSVSAARKGNADIAVGNIVGSNIFNILFVIGTSALILPIPFAPGFIIDTVIAIAATVLLLLFSLKGMLRRPHGIAFLLGYAGYFAYLFVK